MLQEFKLMANRLLTSPNARAILILSTLVIAVLASGAPVDVGGG
jgi:hypothetical protein